MKVSILVPDLSSNCASRSYLLARMLQRRFDVEVTGPIMGDAIWAPLAGDTSLRYKPIEFSGRLRGYWQWTRLLGAVTGDVVYASKPLFASFGLGLHKKAFGGRPLILDIDDWEVGAVREALARLRFSDRLRQLVISSLLPFRPDSLWNAVIHERWIPYADRVTVSSRFLQKRYGGTIIRHARDTDAVSPERFDACAIRQRLGIGPTTRVVMFAGTLRPHKGVEDLIRAIALTGSKDILLVIVGMSDQDPYCRQISALAHESLGERCRTFGTQPMEKVPEFIAATDLFVIPQRASKMAAAQVPIKVFDAMAMAKPIIATRVSDLPEILESCGWIVEPGDPEGLARTVCYVLGNQDEAEQTGIEARRRCIEHYSWNATEKTLCDLIQGVRH